MTRAAYKDELLGTARKQMEAAGGSLRVNGTGRGRHLVVARDGRSIDVYYPTGDANHNEAVGDLRDALRSINEAR